MKFFPVISPAPAYTFFFYKNVLVGNQHAISICCIFNLPQLCGRRKLSLVVCAYADISCPNRLFRIFNQRVPFFPTLKREDTWKQVQSVSHTFYREGDEIMSKNIKIENYIDFSGEMVLFDALPEEQQKETGKKIHDR